MSAKPFLWAVGVAVAVWVMLKAEGTSASWARPTSFAPHVYTTPERAVGFGRYGVAVADDEDSDADEIAAAEQAFEDASDELRGAVDDLRVADWKSQMGDVRDRLEQADDALMALESLRPGDVAVLAARDEVDSMRGHLDRLYFENWRSVRPDLESSAFAIDDEAGAVSLGNDE